MHIPDGYLSPATCAVMYGASAPALAVSSRKVSRELHTRLAPHLALVAAFCFVLMMFNVPIVGGTTAHAVGMGLAAVVLGPWGAILAISVALAVQALFFGDGGLLTYGANCFNMAIVGSTVAYAVYRLVAGRSALTDRRRVVAAAFGGYLGINCAALCAAVEFGVQPALFHTPAGTPLYAAYPLTVTIPAMLLPHLTLAGAAEAFAGGGIVAWLQQLDPSLLARTAPSGELAPVVAQSAPGKLRPLWIGLAGLMVLTPLGLLASGGAWGEWSAHDFADPAVRHQMQLASGGHAPPRTPPPGLVQLSGHWKAPFQDYTAPFLSNASAGYLLCAIAGVGLIWLAFLLIDRATLRGRSA